jgi:polyphosphate kinase 2 (PPK2 family)
MRALKKKDQPSRHFTTMTNGVIKIAHPCPDILAEYAEAKIPDYLGAVDHSSKLSKRRAKKQLRKQSAKFNANVNEMAELGLSLIVALQGRDASGKNGTIGSMNEALWEDARKFRSIPIGAPTDEELKHPYLWRFFRHDNMPAHGQVRVFDRCWQERVLVEKVMKYTPEYLIKRSFTEIRHFEWGIKRSAGILVKIWQDITKDEQAARFEQRERDKPGKKTKDDDINREHWDEYTDAANELFHRTGTKDSPQYIVSSEDKKYAHVTVLKILNHEMKKAIRQAKKLRELLG